MGVLKVVLPTLGFFQILLAFLYTDAEFQTLMLSGGSEKMPVAAATMMAIELQCALLLGLAAVNICSWRMGSTMRPQVALSNLISLSGALFVHYRHRESFPPNNFAAWVCGLGLVAVVTGLVLHQLEPGLLTEDKAAKAAKTPKKYS